MQLSKREGVEFRIPNAASQLYAREYCVLFVGVVRSSDMQYMYPVSIKGYSYTVTAVLSSVSVSVKCFISIYQ